MLIQLKLVHVIFPFLYMSSLWNFRLGHLSSQRMTHVAHLYPSITYNKASVCDIFHFSWQKKLLFTNSSSHAKSKFELLHFDIWGPISIPPVHGYRYFLTILNDFNRFTRIILLNSKAGVSNHAKLNLKPNHKLSGPIMVLNFFSLPFMIPKEVNTKYHV